MAAIVAQEEQPISRTYQYRKVMKPMLERKRRARINRCLDELKELLVGALQAEGESVSRLEKADVLELTVRHLHKLRRVQQMNDTSASEKYRAGFVHCANEVSKYMTAGNSPVDMTVTSRLMSHLDNCIHGIDSSTNTATVTMTPTPIPSLTYSGQPSPAGLNILTNYTPPTSPVSSPQLLHAHPQHAHPFAYMKQEHHQLPLSPSPAHLQSQSPFGGKSVQESYHPMALALCGRKNSDSSELRLSTTVSAMEEEPFDLSSSECPWRPW